VAATPAELTSAPRLTAGTASNETAAREK
jgi:hypothetical protein